MDELDMVLSPEPNDWQENRRKRLLGQLDWRSTRGVEIGPLASPLARRPEADVRYVDLVETDELKQKYALDPNVITEDIVGIDAVWGECSLAECFSDEEGFDWVIASHVVEHVPDLIGWLADISNILRSSGRLYLAVPDYRVTFDRFRSTSSLAEIVAAHLNGAKQPSLAQIFSQTLYFSNLTSNQVWQSAPDPAEHLSLEQLQRAWDTTAYAAKTGDNVDLHCWVFTPRSWFETLIALSELGLLSYRCVEFSPTAPGENEFFVVLEKLGSEEAVQNNLACEDFRQRLKSLEDAASPSGTGTHEEFLGNVLAQKRHRLEPLVSTPDPGHKEAICIWRSKVQENHRVVPVSNWLASEIEIPAASTLGAEFPAHQPFYAGYDLAIDADHAQIPDLPINGGLLNIGLPGYLRAADASALYELAYFCSGDVLELVAHSALSSLFLSQAIVNAGSHIRLVSVETHVGYASLAQEAITTLGLDAVCDFHSGDPLTVLETLAITSGRFGLVFIDFAQSREALDAVVARLSTLLTPNGCVVFHDFNDVNNTRQPPEYEIYAVVEALINTHEFRFVSVVGCCAVLQKVSTENRHRPK